MSGLMDDFVKYAKEQFGYDVVAEKSLHPDTFESLFGGSFIKQNEEEGFFCEGFEKNVTYSNICTKITFVGVQFDEEVQVQEGLTLAA